MVGVVFSCVTTTVHWFSEHYLFAGKAYEIPSNWILAGALIVLLIGLIFDQIKKIFTKKKKKK